MLQDRREDLFRDQSRRLPLLLEACTPGAKSNLESRHAVFSHLLDALDDALRWAQYGVPLGHVVFETVLFQQRHVERSPSGRLLAGAVLLLNVQDSLLILLRYP